MLVSWLSYFCIFWLIVCIYVEDAVQKQKEHVVSKKVEYIKSGAIALVASYFKVLWPVCSIQGWCWGHVPQEHL